MRNAFFGLLLSLAVTALQALPAAAAEFIRSYHSDITVRDDASLKVVETIAVQSEGYEMQHGIFRDFPLRTKAQNGAVIRPGFKLLSVTRDGKDEPYHTEDVAGGIRIYAGSASTYLPPGDHTYEITYITDRWILYYDSQDELYWNVTGNGWKFPIREASATVHLPDNAKPTEMDFYTGAVGSKDKNAETWVANGAVNVSTTHSLNTGEGLTILVGIPKGVLPEPTFWQKVLLFLKDHAGALVGLIGLAVVTIYYLRSWMAVGRDPAPGIIVPRWDAPDGLSPALVHYVDNEGFSGGGWTAFSATALDLAVKGYVELDDLDSALKIRRTGKAVEGTLPAGQAVLLKAVGRAGSEFVIDKSNGERVQSLGSQFRSAIENEHRGRYYKSNLGYVLGGVGLSLVALVLVIVLGSLSADLLPAAMITVVIGLVFGIFAINIGRRMLRQSSIAARLRLITSLAAIGFFIFSTFGSVSLHTFAAWTDRNDTLTLIALAGLVLVNVLFFFLMGAPTPLGRKLMDGIEGLRTYLTVAEQDRMNMAGAPTMSPQHFEKLLPYAVALGVEKPWTKAFETWLATAAAGAAAASVYSPGWYHGGSLGGFSDSIGNFSSSMASTISSSLPQPKSSSGFSGGGGGGFSGGGGGGGGGGGW